jgi:2-iminobutanoate/2-iminopropanoate deaminase
MRSSPKTLFMSRGHGPLDPMTHMMPDSFADQACQTLRSIHVILKGAGADLHNIVKIAAYLSDLARLQECNTIY